MKICNKCDIEKSIDEFPKCKRNKSGYLNVCKICNSNYKSEYYLKNREEILDKNKKYAKCNRSSVKSYKSKYYKENKEIILERSTLSYNLNKESKIDYQKKYRLNNIKKINEYRKSYDKIRKESDDLYRTTRAIRSLIYNTLKSSGQSKSIKTSEIIGCSFLELKLYLESKFEYWMNWNNYGLYNSEFNFGWDIDHIIPISSAATKEEVIRLNHYTNLQPLCSKINRYIKKNNIY